MNVFHLCDIDISNRARSRPKTLVPRLPGATLSGLRSISLTGSLSGSRSRKR